MNRTRQANWTDDELGILKTMIDAGETIPEIAKTMKRTLEVVRGRAARHGWHAYPSRLFRERPPSLP
jgi:hypothetical protein